MTIAWAIIIAAGILGICLILGFGLAVRIFLDVMEIHENKDGNLDINFSYKRTQAKPKSNFDKYVESAISDPANSHGP